MPGEWIQPILQIDSGSVIIKLIAYYFSKNEFSKAQWYVQQMIP